jgi:predicted DNA-binding protein
MSQKTKRLSIMLDSELEERLRNLQASMIKKSKKNVSFSSVVNLVLKNGFYKTTKA